MDIDTYWTNIITVPLHITIEGSAFYWGFRIHTRQPGGLQTTGREDQRSSASYFAGLRFRPRKKPTILNDGSQPTHKPATDKNSSVKKRKNKRLTRRPISSRPDGEENWGDTHTHTHLWQIRTQSETKLHPTETLARHPTSSWCDDEEKGGNQHGEYFKFQPPQRWDSVDGVLELTGTRHNSLNWSPKEIKTTSRARKVEHGELPWLVGMVHMLPFWRFTHSWVIWKIRKQNVNGKNCRFRILRTHFKICCGVDVFASFSLEIYKNHITPWFRK